MSCRRKALLWTAAGQIAITIDRNDIMTPEEKAVLTTAVLTICDPRGNWDYGWDLICHLIGLDPTTHRAQFRKRSDEELRHLGRPHQTLKLGRDELGPG